MVSSIIFAEVSFFVLFFKLSTRIEKIIGETKPSILLKTLAVGFPKLFGEYKKPTVKKAAEAFTY